MIQSVGSKPSSEARDETPLVQTRDLWRIYRVGEISVPAVCGVSMSIPAGQFVAIMGPSGSGKSTFMHLVGCLDRCDQGEYRLGGELISRLSKRELATIRNRSIGFVFQSFNLLSRTTVLDNVALPLTYQGVKRRDRRRRAAEMLELVGLTDRAYHHSNQLSGGQQQRAAIARALITNPVLLLADEPTGNLDTKTGIEIMALLQKLNRDAGLTVVLVTHEPDIACYAQRCVTFRDGRIESDKINDAVQDASTTSTTAAA